MSNARKFKIKNLEHLRYSLKILLIEEKRCCLSYFLQRRRGKSAYFSRAEPDTQLLIDGRIFCSDLPLKSCFFFLIFLPILNCDGATKLIYAVCIYHFSYKTFSVGSFINSLHWLLFWYHFPYDCVMCLSCTCFRYRCLLSLLCSYFSGGFITTIQFSSHISPSHCFLVQSYDAFVLNLSNS